MTTTVQVADPPTVDQFAEQIFGAALGAIQLQSVYLGDRLGWYDVLAQEGPLTPAELAHRTSTAERYAREWLEQQTMCGIVVADTTADPIRFALPAAHAEVLTDPDSLSYLGPLSRFLAATAGRLPDLVTAYRTGGGVSWDQLGDDAREAQGALNRPIFLHLLASDLLPRVPDLHALLSDGCRVADVGCGEGWSTIGLAEGYPASEFDGFDIDEPSVATARRNAATRGVTERVAFTTVDAATLPSDRYDAVFAFECVHDLPDPVGVLTAMRRIAKPGAPVIVMDERTADAFDPDAGPVEQLLYGYSVLCCLPDGMSHPDSVGTGTVMRTATLDGYARAAGFGGASPLPALDLDVFRFYRLQ